MSGTLLEQTRGFHEEIERLERCIVQELQKETKSHKERLHQNHRVNNMRHAILDATGKLVSSPWASCVARYFFLHPCFGAFFCFNFLNNVKTFNGLIEGGVAEIFSSCSAPTARKLRSLCDFGVLIIL